MILHGPVWVEPGDPENLSLKEIESACAERCDALGMDLDFRIAEDGERAFETIAGECDQYDALIINPIFRSMECAQGAEACRAVIEAFARPGKPVIEVHVENIFRSEIADSRPLRVMKSGLGLVCGLGVSGYLLAIEAVHRQLMTAAA